MAPQTIPGHSGRVKAAAGGRGLCKGVDTAGEESACVFGEAFQGLLERIAGRDAGRRVEVRILALTYR